MGLLDRLRGSDARRLRLAAAELEAAFGAASADQPGDPGLALSGKDLERAARTYGQALRRALSSGTPQALDWFSTYDQRISDDKYAFAFSQSDEGWLGGIAANGEAAWREFRDRKAAHRRPSSPPDAATEQTLFEIFRDEGQLQADLELAQRPLSGLASRAEEYLNRPQGQDLGAELTEGREIESALTAQLDPLRSVLATLGRWNTLLVRLAMAEPDPLRAFRSAHDSGNFRRALDAAQKLSAPLEDPADIDRHLHCLAEAGDADGYRTVLLANAARLGLSPLDPVRPEVLLGQLRSALARVRVHRVDGSLVTGSGFLVGDRLVATNRHWLAGRRTVQVTTGPDDQSIAVAETVLPAEGHHDLALLRLAEPVAATLPRLGYAKSVRIGDRVWAASAAAGPVPGDDEAYSLSSGIVDQFESFPEENLLLFKVSLSLPPDCSGGPLFSDLGEVVGVLTITSAQVGTGPTAVFALTADSLTLLLNQHHNR